MTRAFSQAELARGETVPALKSVEHIQGPCWPHDLAPCPRCQSDALWHAKSQEADRWMHNAELTEALIVNDPTDQALIKAWGEYCRGREREIRGELGAWADREAEDDERERESSLCGVGGLMK